MPGERILSTRRARDSALTLVAFNTDLHPGIFTESPTGDTRLECPPGGEALPIFCSRGGVQGGRADVEARAMSPAV